MGSQEIDLFKVRHQCHNVLVHPRFYSSNLTLNCFIEEISNLNYFKLIGETIFSEEEKDNTFVDGSF